MTDAPRALEVLAKREHDPDASRPLTYREYAYLVEGTPGQDESEKLLRDHLKGIQSSIQGAAGGKLVNLALFNVRFIDRPSVPPLATLTWKDWRGDAVVTFPDASSAYAPPASQRVSAEPPIPASAPAAPARPSSPPRPAAAAPAPLVASAAPPPPAVAPPPVIAPAADAKPAPEPAVPPPSLAVAPAAPPRVSAPSSEPVPATDPSPATPSAPPPEPAPVAAVAAPAVGAFPPPSRAASEAGADGEAPGTPRVESTSNRPGPISTRTPGATVRLRGEELITDLFESMHDLQFLRDSLEGADFCLTMALEKMPARGGIVHLYDIDRREYVITCAGGEGGEGLLLTRSAESDPILSLAMRRRRSLVFADAQASAEVRSTQRYTSLGGAKSLVVAPVALGGRFLGAIELLNPIDNVPFTDDDGYALSYIAEQLATFVGSRGILIDREQPAATGRSAG